jgi:hypothetical protein
LFFTFEVPNELKVSPLIRKSEEDAKARNGSDFFVKSSPRLEGRRHFA